MSSTFIYYWPLKDFLEININGRRQKQVFIGPGSDSSLLVTGHEAEYCFYV